MTQKNRSLSLPKGLLVRTTLIVLVPIIVLQIGFAILLAERHTASLTKLMSRNIATEINYITKEIGAQNSRLKATMRAQALGKDFGITIDFNAPPRQNLRSFYDFAGRFIIATLSEHVKALRHIDLSSRKRVVISIDTPHGLARLSFRRDSVTPTNAHQLFVWAMTVGILISIIALIFLRNQLQPIRNLAKASKDFGRGKITPLEVRGAREVREATRAFLSMRTRIEEQIAQRTYMFSGISHDLRTPLTRLKLGLTMLEKAETEALLDDVGDMQALIESFLDFVENDIDETPQPIDLKDFMAKFIAPYRGEKTAITLDIHACPPVSLRVISVKRALDNLVKNALRYGQKIHIELSCVQNKIIIRVDDDGVGIAEADRAHALMPFTRLDKARNQDKGSGVGLGLAIVGDIAKNHGGGLKLHKSATLGGLSAVLTLASLDDMILGESTPFSAQKN